MKILSIDPWHLHKYTYKMYTFDQKTKLYVQTNCSTARQGSKSACKFKVFRVRVRTYTFCNLVCLLTLKKKNYRFILFCKGLTRYICLRQQLWSGTAWIYMRPINDQYFLSGLIPVCEKGDTDLEEEQGI